MKRKCPNKINTIIPKDIVAHIVAIKTMISLSLQNIFCPHYLQFSFHLLEMILMLVKMNVVLIMMVLHPLHSFVIE